jgi:2-aminoadipate transaminase
VDEDGARIDQLEEVLRRETPKLLYLIPNFQNPAGVTLSELRRQRVVELAARYRVPIVEDDPNAQLRFDGDHLTPLYVLDADRLQAGGPEAPGDEAHVLYLGTFSKLLAPGLRIGWVVGPESVTAELVLAKQGADLHTGTLAQVLTYEVARGGFLDRHARVLCQEYRARRDAMLQALEVGMPAGVRWTHPDGGLFLWLTFPEQIDAANLLPRALERGVAYVPGATFHAAGGGRHTARLNFSHSDPERIRAGVERLGRVVEEALAGAGPRVL